MGGVRVKVTGLAGVKEALDSLRRATGKAALERAGLDAMEPMARLARSLAPEDTGELRESIDVGFEAQDQEVGQAAYHLAMRGGASQAEAVTALRDARRAARGARGDVYADIFMGPEAGRERDDVIKGFVMEFGTANHPPHPYMRPAFEQDKEAMLRRLSENIRFEVFAAVEKAAARGSRRR